MNDFPAFSVPAYEIAGYVSPDGEAFCPLCANPNWEPIFAADEQDWPLHCANGRECPDHIKIGRKYYGAILETTLTPAGLGNIKKRRGKLAGLYRMVFDW